MNDKTNTPSPDSTPETEQELWDVLKQPMEENSPKSHGKAPEPSEEEPKEAPDSSLPEQPESKGPVVTEKRKKALVLYLAGLFGIAFLIVLGSLWARGNNNGPSPEDIARLQALETRVQAMESQVGSLTEERDALADENKELTAQVENYAMQVYNLEHAMVEMAGTNEYIEGEAAMFETEAQLLSKKMEAYSLLVKAQNALIDFDRDTLNEAMKALEDKYTFLDDNAMNAYYTIMEQKEQPYLGE